MKITKLLNNASVNEVDDATRQIVKAYSEKEIESDSTLADYFVHLQRIHTNLSSVMEHTTTKTVLKEKNSNRNRKYHAVAYITLGAIHNPEPSIKSAGEVIRKLFEKYGLEIMRYSYAEQSSAINHLLNEMQEPENSASVTDIPGLLLALEELEEVHTDFEQSETNWKMVRGKESVVSTPTEYKREILEHLNRVMIPYINVVNQINGSAYNGFYEAVTAITADINRVIKMRGKR